MTTMTPEAEHLRAKITADAGVASRLLDRQLATLGGPDESSATVAVADAIARSRYVGAIYAADVASVISNLAHRVAVYEAQLAALGQTPQSVPTQRRQINITEPDLRRLAR